jgi:hypothetical protein
MRRLIVLAACVSLSSGIAYGQNRGASAVSSGVRMTAPVSIGRAAPVAGGVRASAAGVVHVPAGTHLVLKNGQIHVRPSGTAIRTTMQRTNRPRPATPLDQQFSNDSSYPTPGLGFDAAHYAAVHPGSSNGRGRHPREFAAFFPFFDGGFLVAPQTIVEDEPGVDTQVVENTPQTDAPEPRQHMRYREQGEIGPSVDTVQPQFQRESEQYVFVRRDGTIIFAVGYTWDSGTLRYVTTEGFKRSVSMDSLDLDATRQFNEQRGLSFRLPV